MALLEKYPSILKVRLPRYLIYILFIAYIRFSKVYVVYTLMVLHHFSDCSGLYRIVFCPISFSMDNFIFSPFCRHLNILTLFKNLYPLSFLGEFCPFVLLFISLFSLSLSLSPLFSFISPTLPLILFSTFLSQLSSKGDGCGTCFCQTEKVLHWC